MKLSRRQFLHLAAGATALPAASRIAKAQAYPTRPVRIMVGFAPGGSNDIHARLVAQLLSERLGGQFIVENRAGAGGNLATEAVVRAAPDGYTLLLASATDSWGAALYPNLNFDFVRDVVPVASIDRGPGMVVAHPSFPAKTVPELIALANSNAESELGVLSCQCLDRRIPDKQTLSDEIAAWEHDRNVHHTKSDWQFTTKDARVKLKHLYPSI